MKEGFNDRLLACLPGLNEHTSKCDRRQPKKVYVASKWEDRRVTGVIGVPGDRDDTLIEHAGRVAARGFHRLIIREDRDPRGRERGAVAVTILSFFLLKRGNLG